MPNRSGQSSQMVRDSIVQVNVEKCKVMHIGHCHPTKYFMNIIRSRIHLLRLQKRKAWEFW